MRIIKIQSRDGSLLYEGRAKSRKLFVQTLVGEGMSLAGADLSGQDLAHLDLTGVDFAGADLTGATLRGTVVDDGRFFGAVLDGVQAEGMMARRCDFANATIKLFEGQGATFAGATLTHSTFEGAEMEGACFDRCGMSGVSMFGVSATRCAFRSGRVLNVDHRKARYLDCDFEKADLASSHSLTRRVPEKALPDRTQGTIAIGNRYVDARFDDTVPAFRSDRALRSFAATFAWATTAGALLAATAMLPIEPDEALTALLKQGGGFIAVVGAAALLKERVADFIKERAEEGILQLQVNIRRGVAEMTRRGCNVLNTMAAFAFGKSRKALMRALSATEGRIYANGGGSLVRQALSGEVDLILADRRHMALALEHVSSSALRDAPADHDVTIIRTKGDITAPTAMTFFAGGGSVAIWTRNGKIARTMTWAEGATELSNPFARRMPKRDAELTRLAFEKAILNDHLPDAELFYDRSNHQLRAGGDGSVVVTRKRDQLPDNPLGAVVIRPNGEMLDAQSARELAIAEDTFDEEVENELGRARIAP